MKYFNFGRDVILLSQVECLYQCLFPERCSPLNSRLGVCFTMVSHREPHIWWKSNVTQCNITPDPSLKESTTRHWMPDNIQFLRKSPSKGRILASLHWRTTVEVIGKPLRVPDSLSWFWKLSHPKQNGLQGNDKLLIAPGKLLKWDYYSVRFFLLRNVITPFHSWCALQIYEYQNKYRVQRICCPNQIHAFLFECSHKKDVFMRMTGLYL